MNPIDIADDLKRDADDLLLKRGIHQFLQHYGQVIYTGSYKLNLLAWPDIDIQLALDNRAPAIELISQLIFELGKRDDVRLVKLEKDIHLRIPSLPKGLYIGAKIKSEYSNRLWKLDIWAVDENERSKNRHVMQQIESLLDDNKRQLILAMKQKLITPAGRTPTNSGHYLYQAILFKNLSDEGDILQYLRDKGIL